MKKLLATALMCTFGFAANAATIDFEAETLGDNIAGDNLGGATITQGGNAVNVAAWATLGPGQFILGNTSVSTGYRADFDSLVGSVSVDIGDNNADADDLYLTAYDSFDNIVATDTMSIASSFVGFETLSVASANISYVVFGGFGLGGNMNVYADNLSFEPIAAVPLPAGGLLLIGALGAFGALRRRKS